MHERSSEHWALTIAFRDLLRRDPASARSYADAKRLLAAAHSRDRAAYQRQKDKVVEKLLRAAGISRRNCALEQPLTPSVYGPTFAGSSVADRR
jgi:hypothetical protein